MTATVNRVAADAEKFSIVAIPQPTATDVRVVVGFRVGASEGLVDEPFSVVALCPR